MNFITLLLYYYMAPTRPKKILWAVPFFILFLVKSFATPSIILYILLQLLGYYCIGLFIARLLHPFVRMLYQLIYLNQLFAIFWDNKIFLPIYIFVKNFLKM